MADLYAVSIDVPHLSASQEQLPPNPTLNDEIRVQPAAAVNFGNLLGMPGGPCVTTAAACAIFNSPGSQLLVNVLSLDLVEVQSRTATNTTNALSIQRITALAGGDDVDVAALDTNASALPAQVLVRQNVGTITTTGTILMNVLDLPQLNPTRLVALPVWHTPHAGYATDLIIDARSADVQGHVLREGEGIALLNSGAVAKENWPLTIVITFTDGTNTYYTRSATVTGAFGSMLCLYNGSGSGVVLTLLRVQISELMTDELTLRRFQIEPISGVHANAYNSQDRVTPVALDTTAGTIAEVAAGVLVGRKVGVLQRSADAVDLPARTDENWLRRLVSPVFGVGPGLAVNALHFPGRYWTGFDSQSAVPFVLREGEGLGLFQRQASSGWGHGYRFDIVFSVSVNNAKAGAAPGVVYVS